MKKLTLLLSTFTLTFLFAETEFFPQHSIQINEGSYPIDLYRHAKTSLINCKKLKKKQYIPYIVKKAKAMQATKDPQDAANFIYLLHATSLIMKDSGISNLHLNSFRHSVEEYFHAKEYFHVKVKPPKSLAWISGYRAPLSYILFLACKGAEGSLEAYCDGCDIPLEYLEHATEDQKKLASIMFATPINLSILELEAFLSLTIQTNKVKRLRVRLEKLSCNYFDHKCTNLEAAKEIFCIVETFM